MKMKIRILTIAILLIIAIALLGGNVKAADEGEILVRTNEQLVDALGGDSVAYIQGTVVVLKQDITIPAGKYISIYAYSESTVIKLDFNGYTITRENVENATANSLFVVKHGKVEFMNSRGVTVGGVTDNLAGGTIFEVTAGGDLIIHDGNYSINNGECIVYDNGGKLTINGGSFKATGSSSAIKVRYGTTVIYNGNVEADNNVIKMVGPAPTILGNTELTINGGLFKSKNARALALEETGLPTVKVTINNGVFLSDNDTAVCVNANNNSHILTVDIQGGTFTGKKGGFTIKPTTENTPSEFSIEGGTFVSLGDDYGAIYIDAVNGQAPEDYINSFIKTYADKVFYKKDNYRHSTYKKVVFENGKVTKVEGEPTYDEILPREQLITPGPIVPNPEPNPEPEPNPTPAPVNNTIKELPKTGDITKALANSLFITAIITTIGLVAFTYKTKNR